MKRKALAAAQAVALCVASPAADAQSIIGFSPTMVIPIVAQTGTYSSEVFIGNTGGTSLVLGVEYVGGIGSAAPGQRDCGTVVVPPGGAAGPGATSFSVGAQCGLPAGSNFGMVFLFNDAPFGNRGFLAYSRTQAFNATGFSVEAFTAGSLSPQSQRLIGLKRVLGAGPSPIPFQSNCFVGSFDKVINYRIRLIASDGNQLGFVDGTLQPFEFIRHLDIFAAAGVAGNQSNVSAVFQNRDSFTAGNTNYPPFVGFCTVQDNVLFAADFRIAKAFNAFDGSYTTQVSGCEPPSCTAYDYAITEVSKKDVIAMFVRPPDQITCQLKSNRLADLELQLRQPDLMPTPLTSASPGSAAFNLPPGPVVAGGDNQTSFSYDTGLEITRLSDGTSMRDLWSLEISARETVPAPTTPIPYSIDCRNGSGTIHARPYQANDDF
jgi:hypothetical protein